MKVLCAVLAMVMIGCDGQSAPSAPREVVIYSSIDEPYLRPLVQRFEKETSIKVRVVTDTEATKSAALVQRLLGAELQAVDAAGGSMCAHRDALARVAPTHGVDRQRNAVACGG